MCLFKRFAKRGRRFDCAECVKLAPPFALSDVDVVKAFRAFHSCNCVAVHDLNCFVHLFFPLVPRGVPLSLYILYHTPSGMSIRKIDKLFGNLLLKMHNTQKSSPERLLKSVFYMLFGLLFAIVPRMLLIPETTVRGRALTRSVQLRTPPPANCTTELF